LDRNQLSKRVKAIIRSKMLPSFIDQYYPSTDLFDLGIDSIAFIDIVLEVEEKLGVIIEETDLLPSNFRNEDAIVDYIMKNKR
jgi:acyl carrier protein